MLGHFRYFSFTQFILVLIVVYLSIKIPVSILRREIATKNGRFSISDSPIKYWLLLSLLIVAWLGCIADLIATIFGKS